MSSWGDRARIKELEKELEFLRTSVEILKARKDNANCEQAYKNGFVTGREEALKEVNHGR